MLHQSPRRYGIRRARWRLQDVRRAIAWLDGLSEPAIYKVLKRLGFSRKQAPHFTRSPDPTYHASGKSQPRAQQVPGSNTQTRIVAVLNGITGRVTYMQRSKIGKEALVASYAQVRAAYPEAQTITMI